MAAASALTGKRAGRLKVFMLEFLYWFAAAAAVGSAAGTLLA
jgi:hypothetical protein